MTTTIPVEARRRLRPRLDDSGCVDWDGNVFFGRPSWTLWMQRAVYVENFGPIPSKARVSESCSNIGCLAPSHLKLTEKPVRVKATTCRRCRGLLSRDVNDKTYCLVCNRAAARRRRRPEGEDSP